MKYLPEDPKDSANDGVPSAEPGTYTMCLTAHKENVETKNGPRDVLDFQGENALGVTVGTALWIRGPGKKADGTPSKGNLWMYRVLAEAMGPDAIDQYRDTDSNGHSMFRPMHWRQIHSTGHLRWLKVTVGPYGVDSIEAADPAIAAALNAGPDNPLPEVGDPQNLDDGRHDTAFDDDDIPF